jgi:hypothetical protein
MIGLRYAIEIEATVQLLPQCTVECGNDVKKYQITTKERRTSSGGRLGGRGSTAAHHAKQRRVSTSFL